MTISDEETNALEFIKENISIEQPIKEYYRKNALFEEIKDMPIIPTDFAWLLDERIVKGDKLYNISIADRIKDYSKHGKTRNYKLFGKGIEISGSVNVARTIFGIISFDKNEKNEDGTIPDLLFGDEQFGDEQYINKVAYKIFLKIWTANVIAKYIFKIYHEVEYSHIYGEIYPTIGECMSKMDITEDYNLKEDAKQRIILEADEPMVTIEKQKESPLSQKPYEVNKHEGNMTDPFEITTNYDPF